jgi:hypothetical protein
MHVIKNTDNLIIDGISFEDHNLSHIDRLDKQIK